MRLSDVKTAHLVAWLDARLKVNARGSVLRDMTLLSSVLEVARKEWQWIAVNPMADVSRPQEPDHRERIISGGEIRAMLRVLRWAPGVPVRTVSAAVAHASLLALQTGARAGEICGLRWEDLTADHFVVVDGKTGRRNVPAVPTTLRVESDTWARNRCGASVIPVSEAEALETDRAISSFKDTRRALARSLVLVYVMDFGVLEAAHRERVSPSTMHARLAQADLAIAMWLEDRSVEAKRPHANKSAEKCVNNRAS